MFLLKLLCQFFFNKNRKSSLCILNNLHENKVQVVTRAVEYTDCIFAVGYEPLLPNEHPVYDTKQSDDKVPVMLELWGMWGTPSLP